MTRGTDSEAEREVTGPSGPAMMQRSGDIIAEREVVARQLGHTPRGAFEVVVRNEHGVPAVIQNAPFLFDGTPMPTLYWLCSPELIKQIGRLESAGGVDKAESEVDPVLLQQCHDRYANKRDRSIPQDHEGPRPSGGVGGTRRGVKCLHAHYANHLVNGDDPIGEWIEHALHSIANE